MTQLSTAIATLPQPMALLRSIRDERGAIVDFRWTFVNEAAAESIPSTRDLVGTSVLELVPDHPRDLFDAYVRVVETGEPVTIDQVGYDATWGRDPADPPAELSVRATKVDDGLAVSWTVASQPAAAPQAAQAEVPLPTQPGPDSRPVNDGDRAAPADRRARPASRSAASGSATPRSPA